MFKVPPTYNHSSIEVSYRRFDLKYPLLSSSAIGRLNFLRNKGCEDGILSRPSSRISLSTQISTAHPDPRPSKWETWDTLGGRE